MTNKGFSGFGSVWRNFRGVIKGFKRLRRVSEGVLEVSEAFRGFTRAFKYNAI